MPALLTVNFVQLREDSSRIPFGQYRLRRYARTPTRRYVGRLRLWLRRAAILTVASVGVNSNVIGGQVPGSSDLPDVPISSHDRVYTCDQTSNTVSVYDPSTNRLLGVIRLGDPAPQNLSPLYRGQLLVHGIGFSFDHKTLAVVSIGSNSVSFIDTVTNNIKHITYVGRSPHEAFFSPDDTEVWVTVRGEDYVSVIDAKTYNEKQRISVGNGPGMTIFRPDGKYGFVCSSFIPETKVIDVKTHEIVATVKQASPFSPNIAATPDGKQVWFTLKDVGKTQVFRAEPPFDLLATLDTGPITNHVNIVRNNNGQFAYITVGGENVVKVYSTADEPKLLTTIPTGELPHGIWPSGDGTRVYVALENGTGVNAIDTSTNQVAARISGGQSSQALGYVPGAVPEGDGMANLLPIGDAGLAAHIKMGPPGAKAATAPTTVTVNNQGLIDLLQAAVTGLRPKTNYQLALAERRSKPYGKLDLLVAFTTNPAGAAIVNTLGPLRHVVTGPANQKDRHYLIIVPGEVSHNEGKTITATSEPLQIQLE
jgi:YVTN family beta-propeller protein